MMNYVPSLLKQAVLIALCLGAFCAMANRKPEPIVVSLNGEGERLATRYADVLKSLQAQIGTSLPALSEQKRSAFMKACGDEMLAASALSKAQSAAGAKNAKNKEELARALKAAQEAFAKAQADSTLPTQAVLAEVEPLLSNDKLDAMLVKCAVLAHATPRGLAEFAQQGKEQQDLVERLLSDNTLMKEMLIAGGVEHGKYGQAMQIYTAIQKASPRASQELFQRLALATALSHATPIAQSNPAEHPDAPATVDPVKRYLHYEKAYLAGELDPAFAKMSTWEYSMIVNSDAPDEILAWGREMLRNYRPDQITTSNHGWRYSISVKTDVLYGSQDVKNDLPALQQYQNIIKNGGVCGRRAFFGRFLLRSFGIPVWGVTQHAHAAVGRWTPTGWVVNLGAAFKWSWWDKDESPRSGTDFLLETQARTAPKDFIKVLRAQWIGDALGEKDYNDRKHEVGGFWNAVAQYRARQIATETKAVELRPVGQDVAESNESKEKDAVEQAKLSDADQKVTVRADGTITVPAVALAKPTGNSGQFIAMRSYSGGTQLHCARELKTPRDFEYVVDVPQTGKYALVARVVTVQSDQKLLFKSNGGHPIEIAMPYTVGRWELSKPVQITLAQGRNTLTFTRPAPSRGLTIKEFTFTPAK